MVWSDPTQDSAPIVSPPSAPTEGRSHKELTEATDRFFDAAAVMHPAHKPENGVWPSLQMGESGEPVRIYFWNAARGAIVMEAEGRGTTRRTSATFPAQAAYKQGAWHLTIELPETSTGMPLAFAIWNGSQQDRDGRKYFTTWLRLE
jgi:DMSO reductase family type II enzyme heme b subunit